MKVSGLSSFVYNPPLLKRGSRDAAPVPVHDTPWFHWLLSQSDPLTTHNLECRISKPNPHVLFVLVQ